MREIAEWLEKLGMAEYKERFVANGIDLSVLPDLTDQDLKELVSTWASSQASARDRRTWQDVVAVRLIGGSEFG